MLYFIQMLIASTSIVPDIGTQIAEIRREIAELEEEKAKRLQEETVALRRSKQLAEEAESRAATAESSRQDDALALRKEARRLAFEHAQQQDLYREAERHIEEDITKEKILKARRIKSLERTLALQSHGEGIQQFTAQASQAIGLHLASVRKTIDRLNETMRNSESLSQKEKAELIRDFISVIEGIRLSVNAMLQAQRMPDGEIPLLVKRVSDDFNILIDNTLKEFGIE